jgi:hypothetical protein
MRTGTSGAGCDSTSAGAGASADGLVRLMGELEFVSPYNCTECGLPFTKDEWYIRHDESTDKEILIFHEDCCPVCRDLIDAPPCHICGEPSEWPSGVIGKYLCQECWENGGIHA